MKEEIKKTLKSILEYVGADLKYVEYALVIQELERLIIKSGGSID